METNSSFEKYLIPFGESFPVHVQQLTPTSCVKLLASHGFQRLSHPKSMGFFSGEKWEFSP